MSNIMLDATHRTDFRKSTNRRLRRLENKVPAIIYGSAKNPMAIQLEHKAVAKALEQEAIFSSILTINIDNKAESVILKALQRHPFKAQILHIDFQRVNTQDILTRQVPLHFINDTIAPGVKNGGLITHNMNQIEIRCQATHLPEFIEVDLANLELNHVIHLSEIKLPEGVHLAIESTDSDHDHPVVAIHLPRTEQEPEVSSITPDSVPTINTEHQQQEEAEPTTE